jgi:hypothetical protein
MKAASVTKVPAEREGPAPPEGCRAFDVHTSYGFTDSRQWEWPWP